MADTAEDAMAAYAIGTADMAMSTERCTDIDAATAIDAIIVGATTALMSGRGSTAIAAMATGVSTGADIGAV